VSVDLGAAGNIHGRAAPLRSLNPPLHGKAGSGRCGGAYEGRALFSYDLF